MPLSVRGLGLATKVKVDEHNRWLCWAEPVGFYQLPAAESFKVYWPALHSHSVALSYAAYQSFIQAYKLYGDERQTHALPACQAFLRCTVSEQLCRQCASSRVVASMCYLNSTSLLQPKEALEVDHLHQHQHHSVALRYLEGIC
jgi:hypothetical protein